MRDSKLMATIFCQLIVDVDDDIDDDIDDDDDDDDDEDDDDDDGLPTTPLTMYDGTSTMETFCLNSSKSNKTLNDGTIYFPESTNFGSFVRRHPMKNDLNRG